MGLERLASWRHTIPASKSAEELANRPQTSVITAKGLSRELPEVVVQARNLPAPPECERQ